MYLKLIFIFFLFSALISCDNVHQDNQNFKSENDTTRTHLTTNSSNIIEIKCDSIFENKYTIIKLTPLNHTAKHKLDYNFIFQLIQDQKSHQIEIYRDTIESRVQKVEFIDYNNDNIKDILIQNTSDARSNWTYNLYLVDKTNTKIQKIKGFEKIKNPNYLPKYDLIDNLVMSGRNWTSFYKIQGDSIIDYQIVVNNELSMDESTYKQEYKKALNQIIGDYK